MHITLQQKPPSSFIQKCAPHNPIIATLLWQRKQRTKEKISAFLNPIYRTDKQNPYLFKEMEKVVQRCLKAAFNNERILIYGDYDVDGVCSAVLLFVLFEKLLKKNQSDLNKLLSVYLPHREKEGYGLHMNAVRYILEKKINLVITCDCGTTNIKELTALKKKGIDVIVIDHHVAPEKRPPVFAFINPKYSRETYPFTQLSACGTVFKLIQAFHDYNKKTKKAPSMSESFEKWSLDLVALATVADMMPLIDENRVLVKWGLVVLNKTRRVGLQALIQAARISRKITAYEIGYILAPRINAAGRIDHANTALAMLQEKIKSYAFKAALQLNKTNEERQKITDKITKQARKQVDKQFENGNRVLVAYTTKKDAWPTGVLGLVAGKLAKDFYRPTFIIGLSEHGFAGSGRSIEKFNLINAINRTQNLFTRSGGHPQACGFTFKNNMPKLELIKRFKQEIEKYASETLKEQDLIKKTPIDCMISFPDITWEFARDLIKLEPFGQGNPEPVFLTEHVHIVERRVIGADNSHIKLLLKQGDKRIEAVCFRAQSHVINIQHNDIVNILYAISINEWRGQERIQLIIKDIETTHPS